MIWRTRGCRQCGCIFVAVLFMYLTCSVPFGHAANQNADQSILIVIQLLKEKGIITQSESDEIVKRLSEQEVAASPPAGEASVLTIVPPEKEDAYLEKISDDVANKIERNVKEQVKDEIRTEIAREDREAGRDRSLPDWVRRIKFGGDIRLRYQGDYYDKNNATFVEPDDWAKIMNTTQDRNRFRYRVRLKMQAEVNDQTEVGIRLATGNEDDPVSTNDTMSDMFNKDTVTFDQAYIKYSPIQELAIWGGRIPNPFLSTDLVWDSDLNFEGFAMQVDAPLFDERKLRGFFNAGVFPLDEFEVNGESKWLYAAQVGIEHKPKADITWKMGVAYYDYDNITGVYNTTGIPGATDWSAPKFQQKGNTLYNINPYATTAAEEVPALASEFKELDITGELDLAFWYPVHVVLTGDYVKNIGFDKREVSERAGQDVPDDNDYGYMARLMVGHRKVRDWGQWSTSLEYKYLRGDAVLDAFTDSDFHGGGTNAKGWILRGELGLRKNVWLGAKWISSDEIAGPPLAIDTLQIDINAAF